MDAAAVTVTHTDVPPLQNWDSGRHPPLTFERSHNQYIQIEDDLSTKKCWDTKTIALGSLVRLSSCNEIASSQIFRQVVVDNHIALVVSSSLWGGKVDFCVEYVEKDETLKLQWCRKGYHLQLFTFNAEFGTISVSPSQNICLTPGPLSAITKCKGQRPLENVKRKTRIELKLPTFRPTLWKPYDISVLQFDDFGCMDGSNGELLIRPCNEHAPSQLWYYAFGQIRNVENGMCLAVTEGSQMAHQNTRLPTIVSITNCDYPSPSYYWGIKRMLSGGLSLFHLESGECIHPHVFVDRVHRARVVKVYLGTDFCNLNGRDVLKTPRAITHLDKIVEPQFDLSQPIIRKEFRALSKQERDDFFSAMELLHSTPSMTSRQHRYEDYEQLYSVVNPWIRNTPLSLPWRRAFLAAFEQELQKVSGNPSIRIPYWSWNSDAQTWFRPETGIFHPGQFGTTGFGNPYIFVSVGFMTAKTKSWKITRGFNPAHPRDLSDLNNGFISDIIHGRHTPTDTVDAFDIFRRNIDLMDDRFQLAVIGRSEYLSYKSLIHDPVFWLHFANMDRIWHEWQVNHRDVSDQMPVMATVTYPPMYTLQTQMPIALGMNVLIGLGATDVENAMKLIEGRVYI